MVQNLVLVNEISDLLLALELTDFKIDASILISVWGIALILCLLSNDSSLKSVSSIMLAIKANRLLTVVYENTQEEGTTQSFYNTSNLIQHRKQK